MRIRDWSSDVCSSDLWCWGWNTSAQLGDTTTTNRGVPTAVATAGALPDTWKSIAGGGGNSGWSHVCGIATDDTLWCWGRNGNGQQIGRASCRASGGQYV